MTVINKNRVFCSVNCPYFLLGIEICRCIAYHKDIFEHQDCLKYEVIA